MSRKVARDWLFKLVFELCFQDMSEELYEEFLQDENLNEDNKTFVSDMYAGIIDNKDELLLEIGKYIKGYTVATLFKIDLAILLIGFYEIKYYKNTPAKIVVNECVELAKKYSTPQSYKFINGVMASIIEDNKD